MTAIARNRAVFLDRDGTICKQITRDGKPFPVTSVVDLELLPGVAQGCRALREAGFLLVLVTNQPDVGRGTLRADTVHAMHAHLASLLPLDRIEVSFDAADGPDAPRRKPRPGMVLDAANALEVALPESWMIGDRWRDVDCGALAGVRTIFIDYGYDEALRARPFATVKSFDDAVSVILSHESAGRTANR